MWEDLTLKSTVSDLQVKVSSTLKAMGVSHELEAKTQDSLFSVDIMLRGPRVVLEVEGPWHYTINSNHKLGAPCWLCAPCRPSRLPQALAALWPTGACSQSKGRRVADQPGWLAMREVLELP